MTAAEAEAALRAAGFVEEAAEAAETLQGLLMHTFQAPASVSLAWRQLVTLQQWAADTAPRHSRSSALAADALQLALLAQQQRRCIVSLMWDCKEGTQPAGSARPVRYSPALFSNTKEELQRAVSGTANLVNRLAQAVVSQRRLEAVEWPN